MKKRMMGFISKVGIVCLMLIVVTGCGNTSEPSEKKNKTTTVEKAESGNTNEPSEKKSKTTTVEKTEKNTVAEKAVGEKINFKTKHGDLEVTIKGAAKTNWQDSEDACLASIRAIVKNNKYKDPTDETGVCQYDILSNKDIVVTTEDGISCSPGDLTGPTDGLYDPSVNVAEGETARMCLEVMIPKDAKKLIMKFGDQYSLSVTIDQKVVRD